MRDAQGEKKKKKEKEKEKEKVEEKERVLKKKKKKKKNEKTNSTSSLLSSFLSLLSNNQIETIRANVLGMLNLADICNTAGIHLTTYATGCIFHYDESFPEGSGKGFKEDDKPNFTGSYYSFTKAMVESLLKEYPNVLVLRVRMPIVGDLVYPRNFVAKILRYEKIVNIPNSMTVLPELLPMSIEMAKRGLTGKRSSVEWEKWSGAEWRRRRVGERLFFLRSSSPRFFSFLLSFFFHSSFFLFSSLSLFFFFFLSNQPIPTGIMNYTNPGAISHNEIMELYKSYVDPSLTWANFSIEEQAKVIVAPRSNNLMDTKRIESEFPEILPIRESLIKYVFEPAAAEKDKVAAAVREMRGGRV